MPVWGIIEFHWWEVVASGTTIALSLFGIWILRTVRSDLASDAEAVWARLLARPSLLDGIEVPIRDALREQWTFGRSRREAGFGTFGRASTTTTLAAAPFVERFGLPAGAHRLQLAAFLRTEVARSGRLLGWDREQIPSAWDEDRLAAAHLALARVERAGVIPARTGIDTAIDLALPASALALAALALWVFLRAPDVPRPPRPVSHGGKAFARFAGRSP